MKTSFPILVNYTQVLAYLHTLDRPGLLWTDEHMAQGFAWNREIVSFGVPDHDGECLLEIDTESNPGETHIETSLWAIEVPFTADKTSIRIGTVLDDKPFTLQLGTYRLVFGAHPGTLKNGIRYAYILRFNFIKSDETTFSVLKQGELLSDKVLTTIAQLG